MPSGQITSTCMIRYLKFLCHSFCLAESYHLTPHSPLEVVRNARSRLMPSGKKSPTSYFDSAIVYDGVESNIIAEVARSNNVYLVVGVVERDGCTLYCSPSRKDWLRTTLYIMCAGQNSYRFSGSHKSRYSQKLTARPVPIDSSHREEAIDVSHARIRAATGKFYSGRTDTGNPHLQPWTLTARTHLQPKKRAVSVHGSQRQLQPGPTYSPNPLTARAHLQPTPCKAAVFFYGPDGRRLGKHRKLMPTALERVVWGFGDGSTLPVLDTLVGKVGAVICWENYMPLLRTTMYNKGIQLYMAPTVDDRDAWQSTMRTIALEGRCFVLSACQFLRSSAFPEDHPAHGDGDNVLIRGGSCAFSPLGEILLEPDFQSEKVAIVECDLDEVIRGKFDLDVVGHYARPDIFQLFVNEKEQKPVTIEQ
ncbi:carbon-nitrogen hydrolase domain-containing protein [Ditylenchus destructor]|uniref:Carbon-nitrogen hydrolase domain-containing protein n=1 Tax=Ditylenchus destructor TaxID=166010 RepID=A0AAD4NG85_9BILA|nr:carbon-nitrogen hydrolase domain-containing protein [Ditylenchus destructor]